MKIIAPTKHSTVVKALRAGKVALLPTDTVYGLVALATSKEAVEKIFEIKSRPKNFNLPIMVSKPDDLYDLGLDVNESAMSLLHSPFIPGAVTLILGFREDAARPDWLEGRDEVAVRIPDHQFLLSVISETGPLLVTSANKHRSQINMGVIAEILDDLDEQPDIVIDAGILSDTSSTILNCRYADIKVEREGRISFNEIIKYLKDE